jgi:hypothetical protein
MSDRRAGSARQVSGEHEITAVRQRLPGRPVIWRWFGMPLGIVEKSWIVRVVCILDQRGNPQS